MTDDVAASKISRPEAPSPFHVLMLPDGDKIDARRQVDENLQHDYLGKRYEAYKELRDKRGSEDDPVWSGASAVSSVHQPVLSSIGNLLYFRSHRFLSDF